VSTIDQFEPHVGKMVHFKAPGGNPAGHAFPLDRITTDGEAPAPGARQPFTLIFRGPREAEHMPEGLYDCQIEGGASFQLYVTPIYTPDRAWQDYQAAFN
jgi:hypothetical protein